MMKKDVNDVKFWVYGGFSWGYGFVLE